MSRFNVLALFAASLILVTRAVCAEIDFDPAPDSASPTKPPAATAAPSPVAPPAVTAVPKPVATASPDPSPFTLSSPPTQPPRPTTDPFSNTTTPKPITVISKILVTPPPTPAPTKALSNTMQERRNFFFTKLDLTDDQRLRIKSIYQTVSDPKEARREMMQVLTEDQREQLKGMMGKWRLNHPSPVE